MDSFDGDHREEFEDEEDHTSLNGEPIPMTRGGSHGRGFQGDQRRRDGVD